MNEFEKGDRVMVTSYSDDISAEAKSYIVGQPGTIVKVKPDYVEVDMDNVIVGHDGTWALFDYELEKLL